MATAVRRKRRPTVVAKPAVQEVAKKTESVSEKTSTKKKRPITVKPRPSAKEQAAVKKAEAKAKKSSAKKTGELAGNGQPLNEYGFVPGTDTDLILKAMMQGGASRVAVNEMAEKMIENKNGLLTRSNKTKNVPSLVSALLARLIERGFTVESHWKIVPPADLQAKNDKDGSDES